MCEPLFLFPMQGVLKIIPTLKSCQQRQTVECFLIRFLQNLLLYCLQQLSKRQSFLLHVNNLSLVQNYKIILYLCTQK